MTCFALYKYLKQEYVYKDSKLNIRILACTITCALVISLFSGVSGHFYLNGDWAKHLAILYDLINSSWPVYFQETNNSETTTQLVYYFGFYLTPSLFIKLTSESLLYQTLYIYMSMGLCLGFLWVHRLVGRRVWWLSLAFITMGGLDIIGWIFLNGTWPKHAAHIEWWANLHVQYPSVVNLIFWVPQHALGVMLGLPLLLFFLKSGRIWGATIVCACLPLWTPFICIGIIPIVIYTVAKEKVHLNTHLPNAFYLLSLSILFFSFYSSTSGSLNLHLLSLSGLSAFARLLLFYLLEFGIIASCIWCCWDQQKRQNNKTLLKIVLATLTLIPLLQSSAWNDWAMRVSIPSLYILWIWLAECLANPAKTRLLRTIAWGILAISLVSNLGEYQRSFDWASFNKRQIWTYQSMKEYFYKEASYKKQYFSSKPPSFFFKQPQ